jgi:glutathione S-transferase
MRAGLIDHADSVTKKNHGIRIVPENAFSKERKSMTDIVLYHAAPSRSSIVLWMLEELGQPFELKVLNLQAGEGQSAEFRKLSPFGKVPCLVHKGVPLTEVSAICTYLADEFPDRGLNVPVGTPARGQYLKWMFYGPSVLEPALIDVTFPRKEEPRRGAVGWRALPQVLDVIEAGLKDGPWLMGERFTAADVIIGSGIRWGTMFMGVDKRPAFTAYIKRMEARPALKRAMAHDQELMAKAAS